MELNDLPNLNSRERVMSFMYEKCAVGVVYMSFLYMYYM